MGSRICRCGEPATVFLNEMDGWGCENCAAELGITFFEDDPIVTNAKGGINYTIDDMEKDISDIITGLAGIRRAKGHDYSGTGDTLDNLREFGTLGVVVRIGDKFKRLKHFWLQGTLEVADEKIDDTIDDLINYALYLKIMRRQEQLIRGEM